MKIACAGEVDAPSHPEEGLDPCGIHRVLLLPVLLKRRLYFLLHRRPSAQMTLPDSYPRIETSIHSRGASTKASEMKFPNAWSVQASMELQDAVAFRDVRVRGEVPVSWDALQKPGPASTSLHPLAKSGARRQSYLQSCSLCLGHLYGRQSSHSVASHWYYSKTIVKGFGLKEAS